MVLIDHPELGFTADSKPFARGEVEASLCIQWLTLCLQVVVRSPSLCLGYLGEPQKEREAFIDVTKDTPCPADIHPPLGPGRWYKSGDLGELDHTGKLTLIDRVRWLVLTKS